MEKEVIDRAVIVAQMKYLLDLWSKTNNIEYYYSYQDLFKKLKNEIDQ